MINKEKVVNLPGEHWAPLHFEGREGKKKYAISNKGRVLSFYDNPEDARLLSTKEKKGRPPKIRILFGEKSKSFPIHHLVAEMFLPKPSPLHTHVIHLDRDSHNNAIENLRWVTPGEAIRKVSARQDGRQAMRFFPNEEYKIIDEKTANRNYAITNYGRLISFDKEVEQGFFMKLSLHEQGYRIWRYSTGGKYSHYLLHRLVAQYFIDKPSADHDYVIHLDYNKENNHVQNLRWCTLTEQRKFSSQSEAAKENAKRLRNSSKKTGKGLKLTEAKVRMIKKILQNPERKTKMKVIARQFGISEMQLYRIKSGENWGWVNPDEARAAQDDFIND